MRKTEFANEEYYHIFNRGVDKREVFMSQEDYERFLLIMDLLNNKKDGIILKWRNFKRANLNAIISDYYKSNPIDDSDRLVEMNVYCLNSNHFHFALKQLTENGVRIYMHKLSTSYTNYFNLKYNRAGALFQGRYKSVHIDSNEYFLYLSAYINKNHFIHGYKEGDEWVYSSLYDYLGKRKKPLFEINIQTILDQFSTCEEYEEYIHGNAVYIKKNKEIIKLALE